MALVPIFEKPKSLTGKRTHYCPGCHHGIIHRLVAELVDEFGLKEKAVIIAPVGCSVLLYDYFDFDSISVAHGRACAVATGIKRVRPELFVISYQGDGDLASIGIAETVHAANRGEKITVIHVANCVYGMTGGQMAPTTPLNMKTTTSPYGKIPEREGYPIRVPEMIAQLDGAVYVARGTVASPAEIAKTKRYLRRAFVAQLKGIGFSLVEVLSACPTNWGMSPVDAARFVSTELVKVFPTGEIKVKEGVNLDAV